MQSAIRSPIRSAISSAIRSALASGAGVVRPEPVAWLTITGTTTENQTLTAALGGGAPTVTAYQWLRGYTPISGATSSTYVLTDADVGRVIRVVATHAGGEGYSLPTASIVGVNDSPTGSVTISGTATQGQTLTAVTTTIADPDGLGSFSYQWRRAGTPISGATAVTYTLVQADVGSVVSVVVSWTDGQGFSESLTSAGLPITGTGSNVVANGDFASGLSSWSSVVGSPSTSSGTVTLAGGAGFAAIGQSLAGKVVNGRWYTASVTVISTPTDGVSMDYRNNDTPGAGSRVVMTKRTTAGVITATFQASAGNNIEVRSDGTDGAVIDNVEVREMATFSSAYFVDSVGGSNSNPGTVEQLPLKDLTSLPTLAQNSVVNLKRGSLWRQQLAPTNTGITFRDYGSGALPIIDGSDPVTASEWAPTAGQPNVYEISRTALTSPTGQHASVFTASGLAGARAVSLAACSSTPGSFYDGYTSGSAGDTYKLYLHPAGSTDPRSNGIQYFANAARLYCISAESAHVININTRRQLHHDGSIRLTGLRSTVSGCTAEEGNIHDIYIEGGDVSNSLCRNTEQGYSLVANHQGSSVQSVRNTSTTHATGATGPGMFIHGNSSQRTEVYGLTIDGFDSGVACSDLRGAMLFSDVKHKSLNVGATRRTLDLLNQFSPSAADVFIIRPKSLADTLLQLNNLHAGTRVFVWEPIGIDVGPAVYGLECTELHIVGGLLLSSTSNGLRTADSLGRMNLNVRHTVMQTSSEVFLAWLDGGAASMDYNVYWNPTTSDQRFQFAGTQYSGTGGWSSWQAAGRDVHSSRNVDPLYTVNPTGITTLSGVETLLDAQGRIKVTAGSPLETVGAGPGRVPSGYVFPGWVPEYVRQLCGRA